MSDKETPTNDSASAGEPFEFKPLMYPFSLAAMLTDEEAIAVSEMYYRLRGWFAERKLSKEEKANDGRSLLVGAGRMQVYQSKPRDLGQPKEGDYVLGDFKDLIFKGGELVSFKLLDIPVTPIYTKGLGRYFTEEALKMDEIPFDKLPHVTEEFLPSQVSKIEDAHESLGSISRHVLNDDIRFMYPTLMVALDVTPETGAVDEGLSYLKDPIGRVLRKRVEPVFLVDEGTKDINWEEIDPTPRLFSPLA